MIEELIARHTNFRPLPTEKRLLFLHRCDGGASVWAVDRKPAERGQGQYVSETVFEKGEGVI